MSVKKYTSKFLRKIFKVGAGVDLANVADKINIQEASIADIKQSLTNHDFRLDELAHKVRQVEGYQPLYGINGLVDSPARSSEDRCKTILNTLGDVSGMRILDIGSSLGYVSFYLANRDAIVQGWEASPQNAEVARLAQQINGIPVDFRVKELTVETAEAIPAGAFDVTIILSVFHHIIRFQGLEATQKMVKLLLEKAPVMIVELAKKGEDKNLPWDSAQPEDELEIFKGLDVTIKKLGLFGNHLSKNKRPLYVVEAKKVVTVNNKKYLYDTTTNSAYQNSPLRDLHSIQRKYYFANDYVIKEYGLARTDEKKFNVPEANTEIATLSSLNKLQAKNKLKGPFPKVIDAEIAASLSRIVISKEPGQLLDELHTEDLSAKQLAPVVDLVVMDILEQLSELRSLGLYHNDVRVWNIVVNQEKKTALLIDYGNVSPVKESDDATQLLWAVLGFLTSSRQLPEVTELPTDEGVFRPYPAAQHLYETLKKGVTDPSEVLKAIKGKSGSK